MGQSELGFRINSVVKERDKNERRELAGRLFVINVVRERIHGFWGDQLSLFAQD